MESEDEYEWTDRIEKTKDLKLSLETNSLTE